MIAVMLPYRSNVLPSIHQRHPTAGASSYEVLLDDRLSWGKALLDFTLLCLPVLSSSPPLTHYSCCFITLPDWRSDCLWNHIQNIILNFPFRVVLTLTCYDDIQTFRPHRYIRARLRFGPVQRESGGNSSNSLSLLRPSHHLCQQIGNDTLFP